jgi:hypothetical protein
LIIENPAYKKWSFVDADIRRKWKKSISIGDMATYRTHSGLVEGRIEMINNYGMDISNNGVYKFVEYPLVKWITKIDA